MTDMDAKIATALSTAMNNGVEAAAKVAEIHGMRPGYAEAAQDIAADIRLLKTSAHEMLKELKPT